MWKLSCLAIVAKQRAGADSRKFLATYIADVFVQVQPRGYFLSPKTLPLEKYSAVLQNWADCPGQAGTKNG